MQTAGRAFIVSLPIGWVKSFGVKKGDELSVVAQGSSLVFSTESSKSLGSVELDSKSLFDNMIWRYLRELYVAGYDEIKVKFNDINLIQEVCHTLIGFVIVDQKGDICILKDVSGVAAIDFDAIVKRILSLISNNGSEIHSAIKGEKSLDFAKVNDFVINQFSDYALRVLNKRGLGSANKTRLYYNFILQLEYVGDLFKRISFYDLGTLAKSAENIEASLDLLKLFSELCLYYSESKAIRVAEEVKLLRKKYDGTKGKVEIELQEINDIVMNLTTILFAISISS